MAQKELPVALPTILEDGPPASQPPPKAANYGRARRLAIIVLIVSSNMVQMISNMVGIAAGLEISKALGAPVGPGDANWAAASYPLTQGTFVLMSGRVGTVYGHRDVLVGGAAWLVVWTVANGFCRSFVSFNAARAVSGIGGALIMPNAVALISTAIPPGRARNVALGFFGASAPIGSYLGAVWAGIFVKLASWEWIFFSLAIVGACIFGALGYLLPNDHPIDKGGSVDWVGAALGTGGLILFSVAWNQAPATGWQAPSEITLVVVSVVVLGLFCAWEHWMAGLAAIMPLDVWTAPSFAVLMGVVVLSFMANGIALWYMAAWQQVVLGQTVLGFAVQWTPFAVVATAGTLAAAWLVPRVAAQWILAAGAAAVLASNLLLATMPTMGSLYWPRLFPATVLAAICPDLVFVAAQIVACNSVGGRRRQGVAASLVGTLNLYGTSLGLGFAGTVEAEVNRHGSRHTADGVAARVPGFRAALGFGAGVSLLAVVLDVLFVRVAKDELEGWLDPDDARAHLETPSWRSPGGGA